MSIIKVVCNKCGFINNIDNDNTSIECNNCHNKIDLKTAIIKNEDNISQDRLMYELENKVIKDDNTRDLLNKITINNDLVKYLKQKYEKNYDLSWLNKNSDYYNLIIKDIMRSQFITSNERLQIINTIIDNELLLSMIDESIYKTDESKKMVQDLAKEKINIVQNAKEKKNDLFVLKLIIGLATIILILFVGLMMDRDIARPTVILLSILPACIIGFTCANKIFKKLIIRIIMCFLFAMIAFYIISYIESIVYTGFVGLIEHGKNMINALPDFVTELFKRLDVYEEIVEPSENNAEGGK